MELERVDCPICGPSQTRAWLNDGKPTRYVICNTCRTVYASPRYIQTMRHTQTREAWAHTDDMLSVEYTRRPALQLEAELIQKYVHSGRMLDIGCSAGDFFDFFSNTEWERYGVELSPSTAASTAKRHSIPVTAGTLQDAHFASSFFDLVSMIDMFYYADDPLTDLIEAKRILKPGGVLAIEIAGQSYMFARSRGLIALLLDKTWCRLSSDSHLYWFTPLGLSELLYKAGFQLFAWHVTPSPRHGNILIDLLTGLHYSVLRSLSKISFRSLTWAPKYLFLARRMDNTS